MNVYEFFCKKCEAKHIVFLTAETVLNFYKDKYVRLPSTITTERNKLNEWYFVCLDCQKDKIT